MSALGPRTCECDLTWDRVIADVSKGPEMRLPWIFRVGSTSNDKCPYKDEAL